MKKSCWFAMLTVVAVFSWLAVAQADGGTPLERASAIPDATLDAPSQSPALPDGPQIKRVRALPNLQDLPDLRTDEGKEELIRRSYAAVRLYSLASGSRTTFELSDFQTIQHIDFGRFRWFDLVTPPGGQVVQMTRHTWRGAGGRPLSRQYTPQWTEAPQEYLQSTEGKRFADARIDQVLAAASADTPELLGVTAITTYRVQITLDGETRTYRAAFLWKETGVGLTYQAYDQITGRVDEALAETIPAGRRKLDREPLLDELRNTSGALLGETCTTGYVANQGFSLGAADYQGHTTGAHQLDGTFSASCYCDADCTQTCTATAGGSCQDYGTTSSCHKVSNASEDSSGSTVPGATSPGNTASCGGGAACAWQACTLCFCSPSVSVRWGGAGLSVSFSAGAATIQNSHSYTCPACDVVPEEDPTNPPPTGGGGGGGGGIEPCSCDCDGDGWVTVEECTFDCGGIADVESGVCWV